MKRLGRILSLIVVLVLITATVCFADTTTGLSTTAVGSGSMKLVDTYPKNEGKNVALENMGIKLYFEGATFSAEKLGNANDKCFTLVGPYTHRVDKQTVTEEAYSFPVRVVYSEQDPSMVLVLMDKDADGKTMTAVGSSEYTLTISGSLKDNNGSTLGTNATIKFNTLNQTRNNTINTVMMFVMFGGIMVLSMRSAKKQAQQNNTQQKKQEAVNPYKVARETGKSVEEVVAQEQKNKAKEAEREAKRRAKLAQDDDDDDDVKKTYKLKTQRRASEYGSKYVAQKKEATAKRAQAIAERKALEEKWAKNKKKK